MYALLRLKIRALFLTIFFNDMSKKFEIETIAEAKYVCLYLYRLFLCTSYYSVFLHLKLFCNEKNIYINALIGIFFFQTLFY